MLEVYKLRYLPVCGCTAGQQLSFIFRALQFGVIFSPVPDPVHTASAQFENGTLFLQLGLPSTFIRHENGAFRKRSSIGGI